MPMHPTGRTSGPAERILPLLSAPRGLYRIPWTGITSAASHPSSKFTTPAHLRGTPSSLTYEAHPSHSPTRHTSRPPTRHTSPPPTRHRPWSTYEAHPPPSPKRHTSPSTYEAHLPRPPTRHISRRPTKQTFRPPTKHRPWSTYEAHPSHLLQRSISGPPTKHHPITA